MNRPSLTVIAGAIRPPVIHQCDGTSVSIEVTVNRPTRCDLRAWEPATDKTLLTDSLDIVREKERQAFVNALPEACREEATAQLLALSEKVIEGRQRTYRGRLPALPDPPADTPASEPVDGLAMYREIITALRRYLVLADGAAAYTALALWIMLSYVYDAFDYSPLLLVTGPTAGCGKSRVLDLLRHLVRAPKPSVNLTDAVLFRVVDEQHPTLLIDEADNIQWRERGPLLSLINGGFFKESAKVDRCVGEGSDTKPGEFDVFAPKAIAGKKILAHLPDTTISRSVVIAMRRRLRLERTVRYRERTAKSELAPLRAQLAAWAGQQGAALAAAELPADLDTISERAADTWEPLWTIAELLGIGAEAREAAVELMGGDVSVVEDVGVELLRDLRAVFTEKGDPRHLPSADLLKALNAMDDARWGKFNNGKGMRATDLAAYLRPFAVIPKTVKVREPNGDERTAKGYTLDMITFALAPYASESRNPVTYDGNKGLEGSLPAVASGIGYGSRDPRKLLNDNENYGVTAELPEIQQENDNDCLEQGPGDDPEPPGGPPNTSAAIALAYWRARHPTCPTP